MNLRPWIEAYLCSPVYRECAAALKFDGWEFGNLKAKHDSGLTLWTANGWISLQVVPGVAGATLSLLDKWMLRHWIHLARAREIGRDVIKWKVGGSPTPPSPLPAPAQPLRVPAILCPPPPPGRTP